MTSPEGQAKHLEIETLKAWCHWKRREAGISEDDLALTLAIENVISQVGAWKTKYERAARVMEEGIRVSRATVGDITYKEIYTNDTISMLSSWEKSALEALGKP